MAEEGDMWEFGERKQLARRRLNAKFAKDLEDTGGLMGCESAAFYRNITPTRAIKETYKDTQEAEKDWKKN